MRRIWLPLVLLVPAWAADNAAVIKGLEDKLVAQGRTVNELRAQLDEARSQTTVRVAAARTGLDSLARTLQVQLDQAHTETYTARTVSAGKDAVIQQLTLELEKTRSNSSANTAVAAVAAAVQDTAVKTAVRVASVRHAADAADLKAGFSAAAAKSSEQSAQISMANSVDLAKATKEIARLTGIIEANGRTAMMGWRLMVIFGSVVLLQTVVTGVIFRQLFRLIRQEKLR